MATFPWQDYIDSRLRGNDERMKRPWDFKQWRGVATRYAKNADSFLAICQIRAMVIWTKLI